MPTTLGPTCDYRVVQIHPLLRCNLRCLHCYSISGPEQRSTLSLRDILAALDLLRAQRFNALGISGGEPLLYRDLSTVLTHARGLGMLTTVTTNGMLVTDKCAAMMRENVDLVAVSVDGVPDSHNHLRNNTRAFELMTAGVERLRRAGVPFGFIFTLTLHNLHELDWVADFATQQGAALLQVHPLEEVGRADHELQGSAPDSFELARGFIEVARLQTKLVGRLTIQYDVADLEVLRAMPQRGFAGESIPACEPHGSLRAVPLAELISPVVMQADGAIVPLQYNFSPRFRIGTVHAPDLPHQFDTWKENGLPKFLTLCRAVYRKLIEQASPELPFVNWYGAVLQESHWGREPGM